MNRIQIIEQVYNALSAKITQGEIPISLRAPCTDLIIRADKYQNAFYYIVIDGVSGKYLPFPLEKLPVRQDIFKACKERKPKERTASMPQLPE